MTLRLALAAALIFTAACQSSSSQQEAAAADTTLAPAPAPELTYDRTWNDLSRLLGGLAPEAGSKLAALDSTPTAAEHRKWFDAAWAKKRRELLDQLHDWSKTNLPSEYESATTAFYPFSGSDFVTLSAIYPRANQSVFVALEWEGTLPNPTSWERGDLAAGLQNLRVSLDDIMTLSFFKTKDMYVDLQRSVINGQGPLLLAFLARTGHRVIGVEQVKVNPQGQVEALTAPLAIQQQSNKDTVVTGWRIRYVAEGERPTQANLRTLVYWSVDVSDYALPKLSSFKKYLYTLRPTHTYIKSASYLLHKPYFSQIRTVIVEVSETLLQDDSGLPLAQIDTTLWQVKFYGRYTQPIPLFANLKQPALAEVYRQPNIPVVPFGIGYHMGRGTSNLQLLRKR